MTMAGAIRQITIERGLDPRDFTLFAFGGGGPLHAATIAREMRIPELIIPPEPGVFSALGMLLADARVDETQTFLRPLTEENLTLMQERFGALESTIAASLAKELGPVAVTFERQAQMRFRGQRHFVKAAVGTARDVGRVRAAFEALYRQRFGHVDPSAPVEVVNIVVTALAQLERPALEQLQPARRPPGKDAPASRSIYFAERQRRMDTPVYQRQALPVGFAAQGPAVIEEYGSSTVVGPDDRFEIGRLGEIRVRFDYS
jgi:N-methylhydantoinase A